MKELRIIIAGSRYFSDYELLKKNVKQIIKNKLTNENNIIPKVQIISGKANGADTLGEKFAHEFKIDIKDFPADWYRYSKRAGYIRNEQMAKYAIEDNNIGVLIAFWDGKSKGTKHMIDLANKYKLEVNVINFNIDK